MSPLVRNKPDNILPLGFIDGPKEPKKEILDSILAHFMKQFRAAGETPRSYKCASSVFDRVDSKLYVVQVDSDRPAINKMGKFRGVNATFGSDHKAPMFEAHKVHQRPGLASRNGAYMTSNRIVMKNE